MKQHLKYQIVAVVLSGLYSIPFQVRAENYFKGIEIKPELLDSEEADFAYGISLDFAKFIEARNLNKVEDWGTLDFGLNVAWANEQDAKIDPTKASVSFQPVWFSKTTLTSLLSLDVAYEAGNHFDQQNVTAGLWGGSEYFTSGGPGSWTLGIVPNIGYDLVYSTASQARKDAAENEQINFGRASFQIKMDLTLPYYAYHDDQWMLSAEFHEYYQHEVGDTLMEQEDGDFNFTRVELSYQTQIDHADEDKKGFYGRMKDRGLTAIFVAASTGRLPTQDDNDKTITVGLRWLTM